MDNRVATKQHIGFDKIPQFRDVVRGISRKSQFIGLDADGEPIYDKNQLQLLPTVNFMGTVKLHGTNAGISTNGEEVWYQSRTRILTPQSDNYDFCQFCLQREEAIKRLLLSSNYAHAIGLAIRLPVTILTIFGEYCGQGINHGTAIQQLPKMFVVFAVKVTHNNGSYYVYPHAIRDPDNQIYNIYDFETFNIDVDFNYPGIAQNKFVGLVDYVEKQCPVGKAFGVDGVGEGIVWTGCYGTELYRMKTKGEKHSVSKVKTVNPVDVDKVNAIKAFVEYAVTENRMNQAVEELFVSQGKDLDIRQMGDFLRWIMKDIADEEIHVLGESGLVLKDIGRDVSNKSRVWFQALLNRNTFGG